MIFKLDFKYLHYICLVAIISAATFCTIILITNFVVFIIVVIILVASITKQTDRHPDTHTDGRTGGHIEMDRNIDSPPTVRQSDRHPDRQD